MKSSLLLCTLLLLSWVPRPYSDESLARQNGITYEVVDFGISKRLMLTEAEVDGQKGMFLFDTGASHLTLNQMHFPDKKVVANVGNTSNILEDNASLHAVMVEQFHWGGIRREKMFCPIADLSTLERQLGYPILGLVGYEVLREYRVEIDYVNQLIRLASDKPLRIDATDQPDFSFDFNLCGHMPVVEADLGMKQKVYLGLDSGASINVLDKSWQRQVSELALQQNKIRFTGAAAGMKEADYLVFEKLTLGDQMTLHLPGLLLTDFSVPVGRCFRVDGLIGIDAFSCKRVAIDYQNFKLHVWLSKDDDCF